MMSVLLEEKNFNLSAGWPWNETRGNEDLSKRGFQITKKTFFKTDQDQSKRNKYYFLPKSSTNKLW